ncbi:MAG: hypothetical protein LBL91_00140 [Lachnospiraceae bacterium]|jgi:hypothetical protein|nr:hypothetical protein [Lachnospiraceae bacterium]
MSNKLYDFLENTVTSLDKALHSTIENTFIDDFLHDLQDYLQKCNSYSLFKELPNSTYFHLVGESKNFLECMAYNEKKIYYVPKSIIVR